MLRVPVARCALHHDGRDGAQPPNDVTRFVKPSHMRVAGRQHAIGHREARSQFERGQQVCCRRIEPAAEEVGFAISVQIGCHAVARAKAQIGLKMLEGDIRLAGKDPEQSAPVPTAGAVRVKRQTTVDQAERDINVLAEISEDKGCECENVGVFGGAAERPSGKIDTGAPRHFWVIDPAVDFESQMTMGRQGESRSVMRVAFYRFREQTERPKKGLFVNASKSGSARR